jgi:hypothetical protein
MHMPAPDIAAESTLSPQSGLPSTFLERGVAVPFATAWLRGARVRPSPQSGMELLVPNLSGAKGLYVLPWRAVYLIGRLSRDDIRLYEHVAAMPAVTPATIREAMRETAARGIGIPRSPLGPPHHGDRVVAGAPLLLALLDQLYPGGFHLQATSRQPLAQLDQRVRQALHRIAPALGFKPARLTSTLMQLSVVFAGVGVPGQSPRPRLPGLLDSVQRLCNSMKSWSMRPEEETAPLAGLVLAGAKLTAQEASRTLAEAHEELRDITALLREWRTAPARLGYRICRTDWLLDGWEPICRAWQNAESDQARRLALREIGAMLPLVSYEGAGAGAVDPTPAWALRKSVLLNEDWRTGAMMPGANRGRFGTHEPVSDARAQWLPLSW